ncbi:MAG: AMP-binding protein, partial [bacterium]
STLENLYGPTELTIACTLYRWDPARSPGDCELGFVPIGDPYPGMEVLVVDEDLQAVADGETGELLMTGPQLTPGYW